jgi:signal transduction histidine kinase
MTGRRWIYCVIAVAWLLVAGWQVVEHRRVRAAARETLVSRGRDITSTLGLVIRSQRRFGDIVSKERLESAIAGLIKTNEVLSIALLNSEDEIVAEAGEPLDDITVFTITPGVNWEDGSMLLANLVDLGTNRFTETPEPRRAIVIDFDNQANSGGTNPVPFGFRPPPPPPRGTNDAEGGPRESFAGRPPSERPPGDRASGPEERERGTNAIAAPGDPNRPPSSRGRSYFGRPPWMSEGEYRKMTAERGVHSFIIVMSSATVELAASQDWRMRVLICLMALATAVGAGVSWRNREKSSELEVRLIKASEMNSHLRQMNLAAAGLAHETRNPLNIIRGLAQLIAKEPAVATGIKERSTAIVEEADRVAAQLNEFINYSRPREVRRAPVAAGRVAAEVARALTPDAEEKHLTFALPENDLVIEADEQLLRQALFNLLLNAVQAVPPGGRIAVHLARAPGDRAVIEVRDDGPGVPPERRQEIFKPYFTTSERGTGLGLAVVQQIVSAHGWEIECLANEPAGAVFRLTDIKLAARAA